MLNQGSTGCLCVWDHLWRSTCRGPLMRVCLWRSTFNMVIKPNQVYPFTLPKHRPSSSQSVPLYPAQVYPFTQPKCNPSFCITNWYRVLRIMLLCWITVSLYTQCTGPSQKVEIFLTWEKIISTPSLLMIGASWLDSSHINSHWYKLNLTLDGISADLLRTPAVSLTKLNSYFMTNL